MAYNWRKLTPEQRAEVLSHRQAAGQSWHSPPGTIRGHWFHVSATCYEHAPIIGKDVRRLAEFERELRTTLAAVCESILAWCVLANHYHVLVLTLSVAECRKALGRMHGRLSHHWNVQDATAGRKCWHSCLPKPIRNESHRWATINYIHHNPVHHGYVETWRQWPFSSAPSFLEGVSRPEAMRIWTDYPILDMGHGWDAPEL